MLVVAGIGGVHGRDGERLVHILLCQFGKARVMAWSIGGHLFLGSDRDNCAQQDTHNDEVSHKLSWAGSINAGDGRVLQQKKALPKWERILKERVESEDR